MRFVILTTSLRGASYLSESRSMNTTIIPQETSVALISGGKSGEREISLVSGSAVYDALIDAGFSVTQIDPAKKEDLVTLVSEDFDVAFLALHGKLGEDGTIQGMLEILGIPYTVLVFGRAQLRSISPKRRSSMSRLECLPLERFCSILPTR